MARIKSKKTYATEAGEKSRQAEAVRESAHYESRKTKKRQLEKAASNLSRQAHAAKLRSEQAKPFAVATLDIDASDQDLKEARMEHALQLGKDCLLPSLPGMPNLFLRSALFGIRKESRYVLEEPLPCYERKVKIEFTGYLLTQYDAKVYQTILRLSRDCSLVKDINPAVPSYAAGLSITLGELLKEMKTPAGSGTKNALLASLDRLWHARICLKHETGIVLRLPGLLSFALYDFKTKTKFDESTPVGMTTLVNIQVPVEMAQLFGYGSWTRLHNISVTGDLANWLVSFLSTHSVEKSRLFKFSAEQIHDLSGSDATNIRKFDQSLSATLERLSQGDVLTYNLEPFKVESRNASGRAVSRESFRFTAILKSKLPAKLAEAPGSPEDNASS